MSAPLISEAPLVQISFARKLLYALPAFGINGAGYVVSIYVNKVYSDDLGVSLGFLSITSFLAGVFAMYGQFGFAFLSDGFTKSKLGRRRPFFYLLAPFLAVAYFFLLFPVGADDQISASIYFAIFFLCETLLADALSTLYSSFLNEQTSDPAQRAGIFGAYGMLSVAGVVSGALISLALPQAERLLVLGSVFGGVNLVAFYLLAGLGREPHFVELHADATSNSSRHAEDDPFAIELPSLPALEDPDLVAETSVRRKKDPVKGESVPFVPGLRMCLLNGPWRRFIGMYAVMSLLNELPGIYPFFLQYVLDVKSEEVYTWLGIWVVVYCICAMFSIPAFVFALKRWGKLRALNGGCVLLILHGLIFIFIDEPMLGIIPVVFLGAALGGFNMLGGVFLSEIIDYDELFSGRRREALYNAITSVPQRFMSVSGKAFPLLGLASLGYQPNVEQNPRVKFFLRALIGGIPICMGVGAALIMRTFPLTDAKHKEIMHAIGQRKNGEVVIDPMLGRELRVLDAEDVGDSGQHEWTLHHFGYEQLQRAQQWGRGFLTQEISLNFLMFLAASIGCLIEAGFMLYYNGDKQVAVDIAFVLVFLGCFFSACTVYTLMQLRASKAIQHLAGYDVVLSNHLKGVNQPPPQGEVAVTSRVGLLCRIVALRCLLLAIVVALGAVAVAESDLLPIDSTNSTET